MDKETAINITALLSDAQELYSRANHTGGRLLINRAKARLFEAAHKDAGSLADFQTITAGHGITCKNCGAENPGTYEFLYCLKCGREGPHTFDQGEEHHRAGATGGTNKRTA